MHDQKKHYQEMNKRLIEQIDKLLSTGDWESSTFLKAYKKKFLEIREKAQKILDDLTSLSEESTQTASVKTDKPGYCKVYISLHQAQGKSLQYWEQLLLNLPRHIINRPIYREEAHIKSLIRSKPDAIREGYVVVLVEEKNIISGYSGRKVIDRLGHELLTVKDNAVKLENIIEFIHDQKHYHFIEGRLQLIAGST